MAERVYAENEIKLNIDSRYYNRLDIPGFARMMKDPSYCYKFYWLEAIVNLISKDVKETTFDEIIDEMIANAWYSVVEFHVHLSGFVNGEARDGLERAVLKLHEVSGLASNASKVEIKNAIKEHNAEIAGEKKQLTHMVPYRALAGFFSGCDMKPDWSSEKRLVAYIEHVNRTHAVLPYVLGESSMLKREVVFNREWIEMIQDNTVSILGWIQFEKVKWLQMNNPEVPGLVYKLAPLDDKMRKLGSVRKLWDAVACRVPVRDVFTGGLIEPKGYDVDHFIPWSFVMNDELWNLMPMDSSLNSSKSNRLPKWDLFFEGFAGNQFLLYEAIHGDEGIYELYTKCYKDNLHSIWANQELYKKGNSRTEFCNILDKNMRPIYDSAKRQGYDVWEYGV